MTAITRHAYVNVEGALVNWKDRDFKGVFSDDTGRPLTVSESKLKLLYELAKGRKVTPFGKACEGFDYSGGGCPGHAKGEQS